MDYGKFKFDTAQKARETRRKAQNVSVKEMKYRVKIGPGDFDTKTRKVSKFLTEGHKVKLTIMFRGREMDRPQFGKKILDRVAEQVAGIGKVEMEPRVDGRNMIMVLAPDKRGQTATATAGESRSEPNGTAVHESVAAAVPATEEAPEESAPVPSAATSKES